jgi:hypothetical protein
MIDSAKTTATNAANQLETRAKDAGIPVDEYKQQAYGVIEEIGKRVGYVQDQVDSSVQDANERSESCHLTVKLRLTMTL